MNTARTRLRDFLRAPLIALLVGTLAITLAGVPAQSASAVEARPAASDLSTNFLPAPMNLDAATAPTFRWTLAPSQSQTAYRIVVASSEQLLGDAADVWDSGRVESGRIGGIPYEGPALAEGERYFWSVMTWDAAGVATSWATTAMFGTGPGADWSSADTVWVGGPAKWGSDFSLTLRAQFVQRHVTVAFRATDANNYYLWQFRGDGVDELAVHRKLNADPSPAVLKTVPLGVQIENGANARFYDIRIEAEGDVIRTYLDDVLIDTTVDATLSSGGFGFYTGGSESFIVDDVRMTDPDGAVLYENDFEGTGYNDFSCGALTGSALSIPTAQRAGCMYFGPWSDYDLEVDVKVSNAATGILLRAADARNNLMWQIRGDNSRIVPHTRLNGTFVALPHTTVSPAIGIGTTNRITISARGDTFTTSVNGTQVDSRVVPGIRVGGIGFRNGGSEVGVFSNLRVTSPRGQVVYENDFPTGDAAFPCGSAVAGELTVPRSADCVRAGQAGVTEEWAFLRGEAALEDKPVAWASLFTSGASTAPGRQYVYRVWVNGEFVGAGPQQPAADENRFGGYDVTSLVRPGERNAIGALAHSAQSQGFIAKLVVEYQDGTRQVFDTGRDWTSRGGSDVYPSGGSIGTSYFRAPVENLDARVYPFGFAEPGFDDSSWSRAAARSTLPNLAPSTTENLAEEFHAPERIVEKGPGHYFIDFGRSWLGGVRLQLDGAAGTRVEIRYGEELTDRTTTANTVRWQMRTGNNYRDYYTLSGRGEALQNWGFRVFRYVEIIGSPEVVTAENLQAAALVYPMSDDARFRGDGEAIDAVWELSRHTIDSQNFDIYGDSWTRERAPYEADVFIQLQSHIYLDADPTLAQYSVEYLLSRRTWPTEWPMYLILAAHELWQSTGDESFAAEHYDALVSKLPAQYLEEETGLIRKTSGSDGCNSRTDCDIVDWPAGERDGYQFRQYNTVVNALAYRSYRDMADIADATGHADDAARFTAVADRMREAMNTYLYDRDAGAFDDGMDAAKVRTGHHAVHASVFAQAFGVTADDQRETVGEYLAGRGMQCSVYCAPFLLQALYDGDQGDAAYGLMTSTGQRSWMNMIALGAGATMEAWDPALKSNTTFSHPWASSPAFMIPRGVFGIRSIDPGYEKFSVKLQPGGLPSADVSVPTVRGLIRAAYAQEDGRTDLGLRVPSGSTAVVSVPVEGAGDGTLFVDRIETQATREGAYLVVEVPAGCHYVSASRDSDPSAVDAACPDGFDLGADVTPRVLGGKTYLSVSATNNATVQADVVITTPYGNKTFTNVQPGKTVAASLNSRLASVPAGQVTIVATRIVGGETVSEAKTVRYAAFPVRE
ncbi:family 78 glycoside hydrolase catalytic domain [Microbacterium sp. NPDC055910]|uniref:family 78 glycoside hydrolase catalytic domain n=1 Tax=Microbacterium sp. NPDC055910 TaxID=3345659 RepID=UPI0035DC4D03